MVQPSRYFLVLTTVIFSFSVNELMMNMTDLLVERKEANRGIKIAIISIERIRSKSTELTVVHSCLCHVSK